MVAPATLSLRPCATPAPSRAALPRAHAGFAPAGSRPPHAGAVSYQPTRRLGSLRRAVAVESDQQGSSEPPEQEEKPKTYYFLVANAKFMLDEEEHFQEQLAEKLRNYGERDKERDFWLVIEPKFLDRFPNITKRLKRPAVALVSTDGNWITMHIADLQYCIEPQIVRHYKFRARTAHYSPRSPELELTQGRSGRPAARAEAGRPAQIWRSRAGRAAGGRRRAGADSGGRSTGAAELRPDRRRAQIWRLAVARGAGERAAEGRRGAEASFGGPALLAAGSSPARALGGAPAR